MFPAYLVGITADRQFVQRGEIVKFVWRIVPNSFIVLGCWCNSVPMSIVRWDLNHHCIVEWNNNFLSKLEVAKSTLLVFILIGTFLLRRGFKGPSNYIIPGICPYPNVSPVYYMVGLHKHRDCWRDYLDKTEPFVFFLQITMPKTNSTRKTKKKPSQH